VKGGQASGPAIRIEGLVKDYGSVHAVRGISLQVERGHVFGFLGPNGAGKSTTIRCLLDLLRPTAGRLEVLGMEPRRDGPRVRARLAYVPGELRLPERLTARQLVDSFARLRGGVDQARRDQIAERLDLDLSRQTRQLSSGNRRKLALLLAFMPHAELLILDEPTAGLDPLVQHTFLAMVREARDEGATIFLSSHILSEVQRVADRVAVLRQGTLVAQGTVSELRGKARQRIEVWFTGAAPLEDLAAVPGLSEVTPDGSRVTAVLTGSIQPLLTVLARHPVDHLLVEEPDLEEAFLDLYAGESAGGSREESAGGSAGGSRGESAGGSAGASTDSPDGATA
jgi:beta-exotoxin I transport system ATP-binding protein